MNLSISNIAWSKEYDLEMYAFLKEHGCNGLEIAPTRIFADKPYDQLIEAKKFADMLARTFGLCISSMQSIWYGRAESIFGTEEDRKELLRYTKKAIDFAEMIKCPNLVFGCPKNRIIPSDDFLPVAYSFFTEIGDYAKVHETTIALEPNPPFYNTNFINRTSDAISFCRQVGCDGLKVNVDLGTWIHYNESIELLESNIDLVNHIHISEPMLEPIRKRSVHGLLKTLNYTRYFSIEMKNIQDISFVKDTVLYIKEALT